MTTNIERSEQEMVRFAKLKELQEKGFSYPNDVKVSHLISEVKKQTSVQSVEVDETTPRFVIAGRVMLQRLMGKACFAHVQDSSSSMQVYFRLQDLGEEQYSVIKDADIGDILELSGYLFLTKTGELTLHVEKCRTLVKCLIPLPEKWHGISDTEIRFRQRYLDLITSNETRELFKTRSKIISAIRSFLIKRDFLEVETPLLHHVAGGADARPFVTHYNALDLDIFLRIALELPLKKLVVGGLERVFEIGRVFRNEGLSRKHNPEFTMLELYQAYADFTSMMDMTQELFVELALLTHNSTKIQYENEEIDLSPPWPQISMSDSLYEIAGVERSVDVCSLQGLVQVAQTHGITLENPKDWGLSLEQLWGELVEHKLRNPTFITYHPFSISPLARKNDQNPDVTDRFELIIAGMEMANGFSELNDPVDQRERFVAQAKLKNSNIIDEEYVRSLEYGLPPTAGEGIGIDRLVMLLTNSHSIRQVVLFPQLRPVAQCQEDQ
jgi:lysyl-tRNA synthetase, class II